MPDNLLFLPFLLRWNERNERSFWHLAQGTPFGGCLGRDVKKCQVYFIHINFFKKPNKKNTIEPKSYSAMLLYLFFDSLLSTCKKMDTEKWPKAADSPLLEISELNFELYQHCRSARCTTGHCPIYTRAPIVGIAWWSIPRIGQGYLEVKW